ncbi:hypothetical protein [Metabacillus sp. Hm71]|uniref:hypothetical protein n=1 Tax=Metabacillus sp. Hm71 TaxID=3450743 RepID=UPI003F429276
MKFKKELEIVVKKHLDIIYPPLKNNYEILGHKRSPYITKIPREVDENFDVKSVELPEKAIGIAIYEIHYVLYNNQQLKTQPISVERYLFKDKFKIDEDFNEIICENGGKMKIKDHDHFI